MLTNVKQAISHDIVNVLTTIFTFYNGYLKYLQNILISDNIDHTVNPYSGNVVLFCCNDNTIVYCKKSINNLKPVLLIYITNICSRLLDTSIFLTY